MRKELLVIKIVDFRKGEDEPAFDVEVYQSGHFSQSYNGVFSTNKYTDKVAFDLAKVYAIRKIIELSI